MTTPNGVSRYKPGALVELTATIIGTDGLTPVTPSWFAFLVKTPDGSVATFAMGAAGASVINTGAGAFFKTITASAVGSWFYRAEATGLVQDAQEWAFLVDPSQFVL